jgi:class 3 adenylate cyclase/tetratricopeptide (TPR) repeat protein
MSEVGTSRSSQEPSERRFLTIEFIDLVGSTDLAERLDPEDLGPLLRRYQRLALSVMERFGGFVAQVFGDGILVYFGYPTAHEHDAERAARAALALLQQLRHLDTNVHGRTLPRLEARIGIHSGLVLIAQELLASTGTSRYDVVGEAINLAARLQAEAPAGGIAISQETMELVDGLFACKSLGSRSLKGLSRKVEVYALTRALTDTKRTESRLRRGATRMVGREPPLEQVLSCWNSVKDESRCRTLAVVGDSGLGKTRLVLEATSGPEFVDATLVQLQCHEIFASAPLYPIGAYFWARVGLTADDEEGVRYEKISSLLDELGRNAAENRAVIAGLLGLAAPESGPVAATPPLLKRAQYEFVVSLVEQAARARPLILWVEDAHWLDPSSAELLQDLVTRSAQLPVLIILTLRPFAKRPALLEIGETITLAPLGVEDCVEVARSVPGASVLSDEMISRAVAAADGVPFFVEQLVISLIEEQSQGPAPHRRLGGVPLLLAQLLSERLDRRPGARGVAQAAACIGGSFTLDFLLKLLKDDDAAQVQERLEALVEAEILRPRRYGAEVRYEFRHGLLQRMAHESTLHAERRRMHRRIADVLQEEARAKPTVLEALAHHLFEAGAFEEAIRAWLRAGLSATRRSAHVEAIAHIRRGLGLLDQIPDPALRRQLELNLQASLMGSLLATQSATSLELADCCDRGLELCKEAGATALVFPFAFGQFTFINCRGRTSEAIALATEFVSRAEGEGFLSEQVIGHRMLGQALLAQGNARASRAALERSLALYVPERDTTTTDKYGQNTEVHTKSLLSLTHFCLGEVDAALEVGLDALQTADALRHPHSTAIPMVYVGGWVFGLCGATEQMMTEARNLLTLAQQHRLYGFRAHAAAFVGWALCQGGNPGQGIPMIAQAIAAFDSVQFRMAEAGHLANLADAQRRVGRLTDAAATCERAMQLMPDGSRWLEPELRRVQAVTAADLAPADPEGAEKLFRGAIASAQEFRFPVLERRCLVSFEQFLQSTGRRDVSVESRLRELSHLADLGQRVARTVQARQSRVLDFRASQA